MEVIFMMKILLFIGYWENLYLMDYDFKVKRNVDLFIYILLNLAGMIFVLL